MKDQAAVELGSKGGKARAKNLGKKGLSEAGTKAVNARWKATARLKSLWTGMIARTNDQTNKYYGAKGIAVCLRWQEFKNFDTDMHASYLQHVAENGEIETTIDRIDSDGDYEPNNCRWATRKVQAHNTMRAEVTRAKVIGATAFIKVSGLIAKVTILDYKTAYGKERWLVTPISGAGEAWVQSVDIIDMLKEI